MKYDVLLNDANTEGLIIKERPFRTYDGRIKGNNIYIRKDMNTVEKTCVLAEELGHHHTSVGDIIDMTDIQNRKQERQARLWGYNKLIGLTGIIKAFQAGCQSRHEMAELLDVTEEYLQECVDCYRDKYGVCTEVDNYTIYFIPHLAVMEKV